MGWPKGKPRKGHVSADGQPHRKWGSLVAARKAVKAEKNLTKLMAKVEDNKKKRGRPPKDPNRKTWNTKLSNKGLDPCPQCDFPEAYGGYCPECGWMERIGIGKW